MSQQKKTMMAKVEQLQKESEEHNTRTHKLDQLKSAFTKFENGELDKDQFKYIVLTDIGAKDTGKLKAILNSSQLDKLSFHDIVTNTDIIKHRIPEEKRNPNFDPKHHSSKRVLNQPKSHANPMEENYHVKQGTMKLITNDISPQDYRELLRKEGINPNVANINKFIRAKEEGNTVTYKDLVLNINRHKNDTFDPTKVQVKKGRDCCYTEDEGKEHIEQLMVKNQNNFIAYGSKKKIESDVNVFKSQKDVFDWDMNMLNTAQKNIDSREVKNMTFAKASTQKNLYASNVFTDGNGYNTNTKQSKKEYKGNSDIFNRVKNENEQIERNRGLNRLNKNSETVVKEISQKPIKKTNTFHKISEENTLFK